MPDLLSPKAEDLLKRILSHKNEYGAIDIDYWTKQFEAYSIEEDSVIRSCFKELSDCDLVYTQWADNAPYNINITGKGLSYFDLKDKYEEEEKKGLRNSFVHDVIVAVIGALIGVVGTKLLS